jgi:outer membrane protein TolC
MLPHLDFSASIAEPLGSSPYKDRKQTEATVGIELRVPLQRNEAKGRIAVVTAEMERLDADAKFTRERIVAELRDAYSAIIAAREQIQQTGKNVDLSEQMEAAERKLFTEGATDLFALQIREQATFDAQLLAVDAEADLHRAHADYTAARGETAP